MERILSSTALTPTAALILLASWSIRPFSLQSYSFVPTERTNPLFRLSSCSSWISSPLPYSFLRKFLIPASCSSDGGVTKRRVAFSSSSPFVSLKAAHASFISLNKSKSPLSHNSFRKFLISAGKILSMTMCFFVIATVGSDNSSPIAGTASMIEAAVCNNPKASGLLCRSRAYS